MNKEMKSCQNKECEAYSPITKDHCSVINYEYINFCKHYKPEEQPEKSCETCNWQHMIISGEKDHHVTHAGIIQPKQPIPEPPKEKQLTPMLERTWKSKKIKNNERVLEMPVNLSHCVDHNAHGVWLALEKIKELEKLIDKQNISIAKNDGLIAALYSEKEHEENEYTERIKELQFRIDDSSLQDAEYIAKMLIDIAQLNLDIAKEKK